MKNSQPRPSALEAQAAADIRQQFAEHLRQFPVSRTAIEHFEKDISRLSLAINMATARTSPSRIRIQTNDGAIWYKNLDLADGLCACHRPTDTGTEFAVVERSPFASGHEVLARSRNAVDVLKTLAQEQRKALHLWSEDLSVQVSQFLAEKYPGQDMNQVANVVVQELTHSISHQHTRSQNRSRGIGV